MPWFRVQPILGRSEVPKRSVISWNCQCESIGDIVNARVLHNIARILLSVFLQFSSIGIIEFEHKSTGILMPDTWQSGVQYSSAPERWPVRVRSTVLHSCYAPKNWCFWTVMLEKTLESPLDCKEIQPVHPKRNQSRIFIGGTDAEAEAPILWLSDIRNWLIGKDPDAGKDWRQEEKGDDSGWDGLASPTRWTWVWATSRSWWLTGKPGVLQSMGSQSLTRLSDWTELSWIDKSQAWHVNEAGSMEQFCFWWWSVSAAGRKVVSWARKTDFASMIKRP